MVMEQQRNGWNPFRPPVVRNEFRRQTNWVPQTVTVNAPVTTQEWVPS